MDEEVLGNSLRDLYTVLLKYRKISIEDLAMYTSLSRDVLMNKLESIREHVVVEGGEVTVTRPLELALRLIQSGYSVKEVSKYIDWRDFERVSSEILSQNDYAVLTNFKVYAPIRMEIDIVAVDRASGRGIIIDCKHWSRGLSRKMLISAIEKHVDRTTKFIKYFSWFKSKWPYFKYIKRVIPLIVTLTTPSVRAYKNVLVVSIQELNSALVELHSVLDLFNVEPLELGS